MEPDFLTLSRIVAFLDSFPLINPLIFNSIICQKKYSGFKNIKIDI